MTKPTRWTWLWLAVLAVIVTGEVYAVVDPKTGDTISENTWVLSKAQNPWIKWPIRVLILALFAWLGPHLAFGIWA